jgi:hypothetical protein
MSSDLQETMFVWCLYGELWYPAVVQEPPTPNEEYGEPTVFLSFPDGTGAAVPVSQVEAMDPSMALDDPRVTDGPEAEAARQMLETMRAQVLEVSEFPPAGEDDDNAAAGAAEDDEGAGDSEDDEERRMRRRAKKVEKQRRKEEADEAKRAKKSAKNERDIESFRKSYEEDEASDVFEQAPVPAVQRMHAAKAAARAGRSAATDANDEVREAHNQLYMGLRGPALDLMQEAQENYAAISGECRAREESDLAMPISERVLLWGLRGQLLNRQVIVDRIKAELKAAQKADQVTPDMMKIINFSLDRLEPEKYNRDDPAFSQFFAIQPVKYVKSNARPERVEGKRPQYNGTDPLLAGDRDCADFAPYEASHEQIAAVHNATSLSTGSMQALADDSKRDAPGSGRGGPRLMQQWASLRKQARIGNRPSTALPAQKGFAVDTRGPTRVNLTSFGESQMTLNAAPVYSFIAKSPSFAGQTVPDVGRSVLAAQSVRASTVRKSVLQLPSKDMFAESEPHPLLFGEPDDATAAAAAGQRPASRAPSRASSRVSSGVSSRGADTYRAKVKALLQHVLTPYLKGTKGTKKLIEDAQEFHNIGMRLLTRILDQQYNARGLARAVPGTQMPADALDAAESRKIVASVHAYMAQREQRRQDAADREKRREVELAARARRGSSPARDGGGGAAAHGGGMAGPVALSLRLPVVAASEGAGRSVRDVMSSSVYSRAGASSNAVSPPIPGRDGHHYSSGYSSSAATSSAGSKSPSRSRKRSRTRSSSSSSSSSAASSISSKSSSSSRGRSSSSSSSTSGTSSSGSESRSRSAGRRDPRDRRSASKSPSGSRRRSNPAADRRKPEPDRRKK